MAQESDKQASCSLLPELHCSSVDFVMHSFAEQHRLFLEIVSALSDRWLLALGRLDPVAPW